MLKEKEKDKERERERLEKEKERDVALDREREQEREAARGSIRLERDLVATLATSSNLAIGEGGEWKARKGSVEGPNSEGGLVLVSDTK